METRIGIDIGGTFTDLVCLNAAGRVLRAKVLSTPEDYSLGIATGLEAIVGNGGRATHIVFLMAVLMAS